MNLLVTPPNADRWDVQWYDDGPKIWKSITYLDNFKDAVKTAKNLSRNVYYQYRLYNFCTGESIPAAIL